MEHELRINRLLGDYLEKREHQYKNPVLDFLFEYYSFRPSLLKRWSPGINVILTGDDCSNYLNYREYKETSNGVILDINEIPKHRIDSIKWILELLKKTKSHSPSFGCFGMHEWAMVYYAKHIRHSYLPLRLSMDEIVKLVESRPIICSHYDAYRFFSPKSRPFNLLHPTKENRKELEQSGCIHANMDLYKWAYKMYPWIPSEIIGYAFELALLARILDMRASPYDIKEYGYTPIKIETDAGREKYKKLQKEIHDKSLLLRDKLIHSYSGILNEISIKSH